MSAKYYYIQSKLNDLVLDIEGGNQSEGTKVITWAKKDGGNEINQLFCFERGTKTIRPMINENMCLTIEPNANILTIMNYNPGLGEHQCWEFVEDRIQNVGNPGRVFDIAKQNKEPLAEICAWKWHSGQNQQFTLIPKPEYGQEASAQKQQTARRRHFIIKSKMHGKVFDVYQGIDTPGAQVVMWSLGESGPGANQLWYEDQNRCIRSKLNNLIIDTSEGYLTLKEENGDRHQQWIRDGEKIINRVEPDRCLDIKKARHDDKAKIIEWDYNGGDNQHWEFVEQ